MKKKDFSYVGYILLFFITVCVKSLMPVFVSAEDLNHKNMNIKNKKCETDCHKKENVIKAKKDKNEVDECRECHVGPKEDNLIKNITLGKVTKKKVDKKNQYKNPYKNMVIIPAGKFIMGTNDRWDDEGPQYTAFLDTYYIDLYEVTNGEYKIFADTTKRKYPNHWKNAKYLTKKLNHPVVYTDWYDGADYCKWAGKRLPTEEEWEKAARGTDGKNYPWGNDFDPAKSNNPMKNSTGTEPVDSYENGKSQYGVYNMSGNVWEWTSSWYKPYPESTRSRPNYGETHKVLKGGSWYNCHSYDCGISAPVYNRAPFEPDVKSNSFGFRCVKDL